jgi:hypothetical protein
MSSSTFAPIPDRDDFLAAVLGQPRPAETAAFLAAIIDVPDRAGAAAFAAAILGEGGYNPDEPRDERGRWTTGGAGTSGTLGNHTPGVRRQGRVLGGEHPGWRGRATPTHEFTVTMDKHGAIHTYSWGNDYNDANGSHWYKDRSEDRKAATDSLEGKKGVAVVGPLQGDESLNPYIDEAYDMLHDAGKNSPSSHANGWLGWNCKTEADRLLKLARELQAADKGPTPGFRAAARSVARVHAGLKP